MTKKAEAADRETLTPWEKPVRRGRGRPRKERPPEEASALLAAQAVIDAPVQEEEEKPERPTALSAARRAPSDSLRALGERWLDELLAVRGLSPATVDSYRQDIAALSKEDRMKYDESIRIYRDQLVVEAYARQQEEKRVKEASEEAWTKGIAAGVEKGKKEALLQFAHWMKKEGYSDVEIAGQTGLSMEEVQDL